MKPVYLVHMPMPGVGDIDTLTMWVKDHVKGTFSIINARRDDPIQISGYRGMKDHGDLRGIWCFENSDDALLFKLTWGGDNA